MQSAAALCLLSLTVACSRPQPPPLRPAVEFLGEWGKAGWGPGELSLPLSFATDGNGLIYVADAGSGFIHKFDASGQPLLSFTHPRLQRPTGIAVDSGGAIYVAAYSSDRVLVFFPDGKLIRELRGGTGRLFGGPVGVAVDSEGNLFVLEFDAHRIQKFDSRGRFAKAWGADGSGPGEFHFPVDLTVAPDGYLYVADTHNRRVQKFTREGEFVAAWGSAGTAPGQMDDITGIAVSSRYVFLADSGNHRLQVWSLDGRHQLTEDFSGRFRTEMETPTDVALLRTDEILLLHPAGPRILRFRVNF